ncbi:MAG: beta-glucuronidase [Candidatus Dormiibacterota bacterium]
MLRPIDNGIRERRPLNGLWRFRDDPGGEGRTQGWFRGALAGAIEMPVPASYNDIHPHLGLRDFVGDVWYQTEAVVPPGWRDRRILLRFDAAAHAAAVWVGDAEVVRHAGGYTPFEADITAQVTPGEPARITVCVNNELSFTTIPPGEVEILEDGRRVQRWFHDFFNYAGLHRSVWLCATPLVRVEDIAVATTIDGRDGSVAYRVDARGGGRVAVQLFDDDRLVAAGSAAEGSLRVPDVHPWSPGDGHLYTLRVQLHAPAGDEDRYELPVGIRTVAVEGRRFLINGRPFHFRGFGRHEDADARGRGHDDALMVRDFALMDWLGANSFRTSHYPYAEEEMEYADRHGVVVIDEVPAVGLHLRLGMNRDRKGRPTFGAATLAQGAQAAHLQAIRELIARDRNHPSVVMWSLANEPDSTDPVARAYFEPLVAESRWLDPTRPICFANTPDHASPGRDEISDLFDVLCLNRYFGWYVDTGDLVSAERHLEADLLAWSEGYAKPLVITEYGADAVAGMHSVASAPWTEEFQRDLLAMCHRVFDRVGAVVGEQVWNLADFATGPAVHRVEGNRKGIFTRDRRPKLAAELLRQRWRREDGGAAGT